MRPLLAVVLVAVLAGCTGPAPDLPSPAPQEAAAEPPVLAPALQVGDWWNFTAPNGAFTVVVAEDLGSDWRFATDSPGLAFYDAHQGDVSYLGPQRKADLAGSQADTRVRFLDFPMADNKTWTTTWDGQPMTIHATRAGTLFHMEARNATAPYARYTYDPAARWFTAFDFLQPDGSSGYAIALQAAGRNYTGALASWTWDTVVDVHGDLASTAFTAQTYQVPAGVTDVYVDLELECSAGVAGGGTGPAPFVAGAAGLDSRGAGNPGAQCPLAESFHGSAGSIHPDSTGTETWGYTAGGAAGAAGTVDFTVLQRTLALAPLKAAAA